MGKLGERDYQPWMCDKIQEIAGQGGHIAAMMLGIGIKGKDTWYRWIRDIPEFRRAVEYAHIISQAYYEQIGLKGMLGEIDKFNMGTYALVMNNKFPQDYKRSSTGSTTEVNIGSINSLSNLSQQELELKINRALKINGYLPAIEAEAEEVHEELQSD